MNNLILVPALGCNEHLYAKITPALSPVAEMQNVIPKANRYDAMVQDLLDQSPSEFIILGTSMGARLALETTLAAPDRVQGLVVIGAGPGPVADQATGLRRSARIRGGEFEQVIAEMSEKIAEKSGPNGPSTLAAFRSMALEVGPDITAQQSDALAYRTDLWPHLTEIRCPTLFLWGKEDQFSPNEDATRMNTIVAGSRCAIIDGCGHFPTLEYPEQSATIILQWIRENFRR